jgi:hypothetical protein
MVIEDHKLAFIDLPPVFLSGIANWRAFRYL